MEGLVGDALLLMARVCLVVIFPFSGLDKIFNWQSALKHQSVVPLRCRAAAHALQVEGGERAAGMVGGAVVGPDMPIEQRRRRALRRARFVGGFSRVRHRSLLCTGDSRSVAPVRASPLPMCTSDPPMCRTAASTAGSGSLREQSAAAPPASPKLFRKSQTCG